MKLTLAAAALSSALNPLARNVVKPHPVIGFLLPMMAVGEGGGGASGSDGNHNGESSSEPRALNGGGASAAVTPIKRSTTSESTTTKVDPTGRYYRQTFYAHTTVIYLLSHVLDDGVVAVLNLNNNTPTNGLLHGVQSTLVKGKTGGISAGIDDTKMIGFLTKKPSGEQTNVIEEHVSSNLVNVLRSPQISYQRCVEGR